MVVARKWFNDGVQAIADGGSSGASLAVQELVRANGRIFLISGAGANQLTDEACAPTSVQWTHDAYSTATAVVSGIMQSGKEPWFFITGDYAFGHSIEATARARIAELGGAVAGSVKAQLGTPDYSSFLLQAQSSGARIFGDQCRRRQRHRHQAGGGIRARRPRHEDRTDVLPECRHPRRWAEGDARRSDPHQLLRGRLPRGAPLLRCLLCPPQRDALANSGRRLLSRASLFAGGEGYRIGRRRDRHGEDEDHAGLGRVHLKWPGPARISAWCTICIWSRSRRPRN